MKLRHVGVFFDRYFLSILILGLVLLSLRQQNELHNANVKLLDLNCSNQKLLLSIQDNQTLLGASQVELLRIQHMISSYEVTQTKMLHKFQAYRTLDQAQFNSIMRKLDDQRRVIK